MACWYLGLEEQVRLWHSYAKGNGVAIRSTYRRLKTVLDALASEDKAHLGLVRYGSAHLVPGRVNLMINVSTKQLKYANEQQVRAMLWLIDPHETGSRHIDLDSRFHPRPIYPTGQPEGVHRQVDLRTLIEGVIVSPFAEPHAMRETEELIKNAGHFFQVTRSSGTAGASLLPTEEELRKYL